ncbi:MAG: PIN domain-containing protein [Candidatus Aenigmarchaeota archaeon]|nr:PIN domain-containing protein [Candidatus Aenigmarchaeota archaeon]
MNDELFYDTTILVYAYDESETEKGNICKSLVENVFSGESKGVISNQVLAELFSVLTTKMKIPLSKEVAESLVDKFVESSNWIRINYTEGTVKSAMSTSKVNKTEFWDSLIAETMKENGIETIYTENEKDFKKIPGIKVVNPFKEKF